MRTVFYFLLATILLTSCSKREQFGGRSYGFTYWEPIGQSMEGRRIDFLSDGNAEHYETSNGVKMPFSVRQFTYSFRKDRIHTSLDGVLEEGIVSDEVIIFDGLEYRRMK